MEMPRAMNIYQRQEYSPEFLRPEAPPREEVWEDIREIRRCPRIPRDGNIQRRVQEWQRGCESRRDPNVPEQLEIEDVTDYTGRT